MTELGPIASIHGLVGAGAKLSIVLFDLASTVGSPSQLTELELIGTEITLFCSVLKQIKFVLLEPETYHFTDEAVELTRQIVDRCRLVIDEIERIVSSLKQSEGAGDIPSIDWVSKVKWTFKKSKVAVQRQTLESCKRTLHLLLTTMEWSKNFSRRRVITAETVLEDEQDQMMTQGLVIAQQYSIDQLSRLEDHELAESDASPIPSGKKSNVSSSLEDRRSGRVSNMFERLSVRTRSPSPRPVSAKRTSIWLNELVFGDETPSDPHPGVRQKRLSSFTTAQEPLHLLKKWTDHGERVQRHYSIFDGGSSEKQSVFANSTFSFPENLDDTNTIQDKIVDDADSHTPVNAKPTRVHTIPISPRTSMMVSKPTLPVATGVALPVLVEETNLSEVAYEQYLSLVLDDIGLHYEASTYELVVTYGGQSRVLQPSDRPYLVFDQLQQVGLQPQFVLRRMTEPIRHEIGSQLRLTKEPASWVKTGMVK